MGVVLRSVLCKFWPIDDFTGVLSSRAYTVTIGTYSYTSTHMLMFCSAAVILKGFHIGGPGIDLRRT